MKSRLAISSILAFLILSGCSLAEDITPPPGYLSPTPAPTIGAPTLTPLPTSTLQPATPTIEPTIGTESVTLTLAANGTAQAITPTGSLTPAVAPVTVSGKTTDASGAAVSGNLTATLYLYNTSTGNVDQTVTASVQPDGTYLFNSVLADTSLAYIVSVNYGGVTYTSNPASYDATKSTYDLPVTVYDSTDNLDALTVSQVHMSYDFSTAGKLQVQVLYVVSNPGSKTVTVASDGSTVPFIQLPTGASDVQYQMAQGSAPLMSAANGFALIPGADRQYGILVQFSLPYTNSIKIVQPFRLPVSAVTVIVPEGVRVRSEQLKDTGTQTYQSTVYQLYQGNNLAAGSTLSLTVSGQPGAPTGFSFTRQTIVLIGIGVIGLLLIGVGIYFFLHDRKLAQQEEAAGAEETASPDALGADQDSITDAIIALDDQFKTGGISKEAYDKRRAELKERLKAAL